MVHEQFFTDTTDYADVVLPAPTFLEVKDVQGAYGHLFAQMSQQAIAPLGEAWSNVRLFGELARRMGFTESCFSDTEDELIDQALAWTRPIQTLVCGDYAGAAGARGPCGVAAAGECGGRGAAVLRRGRGSRRRAGGAS